MIQQPPPYNAQPQVVTVQQPTTVVVGTATNSQERPGAWKTMLGTGITQFVFGVLTIILGIVAVSTRRQYEIGTPIWNGICFYCVAGILGIIAGKTKHKCPTVGYMVMSIFACLSSIGVITGSSVSLGLDCGSRYQYRNNYDFRYSYSSSSRYYTSGCQTAAIVVCNIALLILAFAEFIIAIIGASSTCGAVCCTGRPGQVVQYYHQQGQAMVVQPPTAVVHPAALPSQQQQPMGYPAQPGMATAPPQNFQPAHPPAQPPPGKSMNEPAPANTHIYQDLNK